jgi:hypothetical protein
VATGNKCLQFLPVQIFERTTAQVLEEPMLAWERQTLDAFWTCTLRSTTVRVGMFNWHA